MMIQSIQHYPSTSAPAGGTVGTASDPLASKGVFLQLLVAQLKHQNPLQPQDGLQFVTQLAQFSQLEQSTQITQDLDAIRQELAPPAKTGGN